MKFVTLKVEGSHKDIFVDNYYLTGDKQHVH